jgi:TolB-like protein
MNVNLRLTSTIITAIAIAALTPLAGRADDGKGGGRYVPSETRVAILPFINLTGEKTEELLGDVEMADHAVAALFMQRGFRVVGDAEVLAAMAEAGMPVHDRAERTPEQLGAVARRVNARLVVVGLLIDKRSTLKSGGFGAFRTYKKEGRAAARARVWDEIAKGFVAQTSATGVTGSGWSLFVGTVKYSDLRSGALLVAVQNSLADLLEPYPVLASQVEVSARGSYRPAMAEALALPETKWDPKQTRVMVLPFLDETKVERRDAESAAVAEEASRCAAQEFVKCGFQVLSREQVAAAAEKSGLDLADEKARTRSAIRAVGQAAPADVVVTGSFLLSILDRGQRIVKVEVKVYDMASERYVVATGGSAGSTKRGRAVSGAVYHVLQECLSRYRP